ncbi:MAG: TM2 domain-containing membrane protein YozV [Psychroserpens sp.]|jgi:TM2 domain-containing membrane protein YozV
MAQQGSGGNVLAAICSFFIPGLGQLVQGRLLPAILFFVFASIFWALSWLIFPIAFALITHLWAIIDAAKFSSANRF